MAALVDSYSGSNEGALALYYAKYRLLGQSFACSSNAVLQSTKFWCGATGGPTGDIYAVLYAHTTSDAGDGSYSFITSVSTANLFVVAFKDGATPVSDVTTRDLQGTA